MSLDSLFELLCHELDLAALPQKDKHGIYHLTINRETELSLSELDPGLYLFSRMTPLPKLQTKEALFIYLMRANFLGISTGGATIGLDQAEKFLMLSFALPHELNYKLFRDSLEDFVNYLTFWRKKIALYQEKMFK